MIRGLVVILPFVAVMAAGIAGETQERRDFPQNTDIPPIGHTDPARYKESHRCHGGAGTIRFMRLQSSETFRTNIFAVNRGVLPPGSGIGEHLHRRREEMYIIFTGTARFTVNGHTAELPAGSMVLCPLGSSHGIYNPNDEDVQWMSLAVTLKKGDYDAIDYGDDLVNAKVESPAPFLHARFDRSLLHPAPHAHMGKGTILFRRVWSDENFKTDWYFIDHCLLPPDTSIGYHQHNTIEEVYYVMSGRGRFTVNGKTFDVKEGDALPCRLHDSHGLYNNTDEPLEILVFSVADGKGNDRWTKNWGDDLSGR